MKSGLAEKATAQEVIEKTLMPIIAATIKALTGRDAATTVKRLAVSALRKERFILASHFLCASMLIDVLLWVVVLILLHGNIKNGWVLAFLFTKTGVAAFDCASELYYRCGWLRRRQAMKSMRLQCARAPRGAPHT